MQRSKRSESASTFEEEAARLRAYMASRSHGSLPAVVVVNTDRRSYQEKSNYFRPLCMLKFMFSKKATQIDEIFTIDLILCTYRDYVVSVKPTVKILSIFVACLENTNFTIKPK